MFRLIRNNVEKIVATEEEKARLESKGFKALANADNAEGKSKARKTLKR